MSIRTLARLAFLGLVLAALTPSNAIAAAPAVSLSTHSLNFGPEPWLQPSAAMTITVTNTGDAPLSIQSVDVSGSAFGPVDFSVASISPQPCPPSYIGLAPGAQCQIPIVFTPQSGGPRAETLSIYDNAPDSPQTVAATGAGSGAVIRFAPTALDFGVVLVGTTSAPMTFSAVNAGDGPVSISSVSLGPAPLYSTWFAVTSDACSGATLGGGQRCSISLTVSPTAVESGSQAVTLTDSAGTGRQTYDQIGARGGGAKAALLQVPRFSQGAGTSSVVTPVQVFDQGTLPLQISSVSFDNTSAGFAIAHDGCSGTTVALNTPFNFPPPTCEVDIVFTPPAAGAFNANLVIHDNAFGGSESVAISGGGYAPAAVVSTSAIDYGFQLVGGAAAVRTVTIANPSPQPLAVAALSLTTSLGSFQVTADTCSGTTVAAGGSCTFNVEFAPVVSYLFTGTVTVRDNAPEPAPTISLRGEGQAPTFTISTTNLDFGHQHVNVASDPLTFTVTNTSADALSFHFLTGYFAMPWSGCSNPVPPGGSCTVAVTVTPASVGDNTVLFKAVDPSGNQQVLDVHWLGTTGEGRIEGDSLTRIAQQPGTTLARTAVVINGGSDALKIGQVSLAPGGPVTITSDQCSNQTLAIFKNCVVTLTIHPTVAGSWFTTLTVPTDAAVGPNPVTAPVSGTAGTPQPVLFPTSVSFPAQRVGTSMITQVVWVAADALVPAGDQMPLTISSVTIGGPDAASFLVAWDGCSALVVEQSFSCPIGVGFVPTAGGVLSASLLFADDGAGSPQAVSLSGTGLAPAVQLSPQSVDFGNVIAKTKSAPVTITLTNGGNFALKVARDTVTGTDKGDFTIMSQTCQNKSLAPGASCQVVIVLRPAALGTRSAELTFTDDAPNSPQSVPLVGAGVAR